MRLSAGRDCMSRELQVLCFLAGANSIFFGEKLLTAPNPAAAGSESAGPNTMVAPVDMGLPGSLPTVNQQAKEQGQ